MTQGRKKRKMEGLWNVLSFLGLFGIIGMIVVILTIFNNPASLMNPFPPPTVPAPIIMPTSTITPMSLPATWTPTVSEETLFVESTSTSTPTAILATLLPEDALILETVEIESTASAKGYYRYDLKSKPAAIQASILKPELANAGGECSWMGVAGQVMDVQGSPETGVQVQLGNQVNGQTTSVTTLSGTATQYGPAGYEFTISDIPYGSVQNFYVRLLDQQGLALSERIYFDTYEDCDRNLIIITFQELP